ncbi:carboxymuconolactone decarboxylase family protein [Undibacterium terreum]|uniref:Alkyl hydroperoxide reductase AhpD n=1 Tax=Undibacterium terreum TaxID=1224302 RepID=A0A916U5Y9_9BURK|nr:carboxymuconolactone decarboxylase family protein [Undibacterium terreum]GGC60416.1 alkyl hydroperoxide reductase AhpD [Undibacterium terreum]
MNRISIPAAEQTPAASQPLLAAVHKQLGVVPNMMKLLGNSPAALEGYLSLSGALGKGAIGAKTGERIALAIAEYNACGYCLAAHTYLGGNLAKLDAAEINANRQGSSNDAKANAAVRFAVSVAKARGHASEADLQAVRAAGYGNAEILEIVLHVALNTLTNYVNEVAQTEVDFPVALPLTK